VVAAIALEDDLVLVPARPGGSPVHRDALDIAALPVGCSVGRSGPPSRGGGVRDGTPTLVGSRST